MPRRPEILTKRKSMWEKVSARSHKPIKIFPFPSSSSGGGEEVMLYGTVDYVLKNGGKNVSVDWAARAHLVEQAGELKMDFYQVYLVSTCLLFFSFVGGAWGRLDGRSAGISVDLC